MKFLHNMMLGTRFYFHLFMKDYNSCSNTLERGSLKMQNAELFHYFRGILYKSQGLLEDAAREFEEALKKNPLRLSNHMELIEALFRGGKFRDVVEKSKTFFPIIRDKIIVWNEKPFYKKIHYYIAVSASKINEFQLACESFSIINGYFENQAEVLATFGYCLLQLGELSKAEQVLRRALQVDKNLFSAKENLRLVQQYKSQNTLGKFF